MTDRFFVNHGPFSLDYIAKAIKASVYYNGNKQDGVDDDIAVADVANLKDATKSDLTFFSNNKYSVDFSNTKALVCITSEKFLSKSPRDVFILISNNPYADYARIATLFYPGKSTKETYIHSSAIVDKGAEIGKNSQVYPGVYIGDGVVIGENCIIHHNVTLSNCIIGNNVTIHSGARIGQDGFGFAFDNFVHVKVPQIGRVLIGNDVEIGANSTIDRGTIGDTIIGDMCKIDNLVQIGHNVKLGRGCIVVAQVGISGSTTLGQYVVVGGQGGISGHLRIADGVQIAAQSGVIQDITEKQAIVGGTPSVPIRQWHKQSVFLKKLTNKEGHD